MYQRPKPLLFPLPFPRKSASTSSERRCGRPCSLAKSKAPIGSGFMTARGWTRSRHSVAEIFSQRTL